MCLCSDIENLTDDQLKYRDSFYLSNLVLLFSHDSVGTRFWIVIYVTLLILPQSNRALKLHSRKKKINK